MNHEAFTDGGKSDAADAVPGQDLLADRERQFDNFRRYGETFVLAFDTRYRPAVSEAALSRASTRLAEKLVGLIEEAPIVVDLIRAPVESE